MRIDLEFTEEDISDVRRIRDKLVGVASTMPADGVRSDVLEARAIAEDVLTRFEQREAQAHRQAVKAQAAEVRS